MRSLLIIFCLFTVGLPCVAQTWETGISIGTTGYMGDINPVKPYEFTDLAFGAQFKRNFNGHLAAKLNFLRGKVQADDLESGNAHQVERRLNFRSPITELSLQVEFNLFKYSPGDLPGYGTRRASPFIFAGVSGFKFDPRTDYNDEEIRLQPVQTEAVDYKTKAISIPYGAGFKYNITGNFNLIGEIGYRTAFTDYIDDISGKYPDFGSTPPADPLSIPLSDRSLMGFPSGVQRGDFRKHDTYMFAGISLTYTFVSFKCPTF